MEILVPICSHGETEWLLLRNTELRFLIVPQKFISS